MKHVSTLDGLRGVAALLVVWVHFPQMGTSAISAFVSSLAHKVNAGYLGVDIFFVLSGFLITRILLKDKREGRISFSFFYYKRLLRIFPIYYLVVLLSLIIFGGDEIIWCLTYLSNYYFAFNSVVSPLAHTWSLAVEEQFYLVWPLIVFLLPVRRSRFLIAILLPIAALVFAMYTEMSVDKSIARDLVYRGVQYRMLSLCFGSAMAFYEDRVAILPTLFPICLCLVSLLGIGALAILETKGIFSQNITLLLLLASFFSLSVVMFALICDNKRSGLVKSILTGRVLKYFGKISYGLYLYHHIILFYFGVTKLQSGEPVSVGFGLLLIFLCIFIPTASYYLIEAPIMSFKNKKFNRKVPSSVSGGGVVA